MKQVTEEDVERIARAALQDLGFGHAQVSVAPDTQPGGWLIGVRGALSAPATIRVRCGAGTTPQWVRQQIVDQCTR